MDGSINTGNFKSERYDAKGILKYTNGSTLRGEWDKGDLDGKAILTTAKGYIMKYENDIKKSYHKRKKYSRSVTKKNIKYFNPAGREITEKEF